MPIGLKKCRFLKKNLLLAVFVCISTGTVAQLRLPSVAPSSPDTRDIIQLHDYPVNYATGVPEITIPICELKCGSISIPISISYHASGRKVTDVPGAVGNGWVLNAGGVISREIRGKPDDNTFWPSNLKNAYQYNDANDYDQLAAFFYPNASGNLDTEQDIYSFSMGSKSGKFVYGTSQKGKTGYFIMPEQSIVVSPPGSGGRGYPSVITDEKGNTFVFTANENQNYSPYGLITSAKYLTSEISANKKDTIGLTYVGFSANEPYQYASAVLTTSNNAKSTVYPYSGVTASTNTRYYDMLRIARIGCRTGAVEFVKRAHTDPNADMIVSIRLLDDKNNLVKQWALKSSYLDILGSYAPAAKLDTLIEQDRNGNEIQRYTFEYNPGAANGVMSRDYWGYYNGNNPNNVPYWQNQTGSYYGGPSGSYNVGSQTADRKAYPAYAQAGVLKSITFPAGSKTEFKYEGNTYFVGQLSETWYGLRIAQIKTTDLNGATTYREFEYENPTVPYYVSSITSDYFTSYFTHYYNTVPYPNLSLQSYSQRTYNSDFNADIADVLNQPIAYGKVTEYTGTKTDNIGKTEYYFNNLLGNNRTSTTGSEWRYGSAYNLWAQPDMYEVKTYKNVAGNYTPVKEEFSDYQDIYSDTLVGMHIKRIASLDDDQRKTVSDAPDDYEKSVAQANHKIFDYATYEMYIGHKELESSATTLYSDSGNVKTTTYYKYNSKLLVSEQYQISSTGDTMRTTFKYPFEDNATVSQQLTAANMLDNPIEINEYKNSSLLRTTRNLYKNWNGLLALEYVQTSTPISALENRIHYYNYDARGNIASMALEKDVKKSFLYNATGFYPIAAAENAGDNEILFSSLEEGTGWSGNSPAFGDKPLSAYDSTRSHAGKYSGRIDKAAGAEQYTHATNWLSVTLTAPTKYKYSGWVYSNGPSVDLYLFMKKAGESTYFTYVDFTTTSVINQWVYLEKEFSVPADVVQIGIRVDNNGGGSIWFDDIRVHPSAATMTTYTYAPQVGVTSISDINNLLTTYEYDDAGRLVLIRDKDQNILKKTCYGFSGRESCEIYWNTAKTASAKRNNCPSCQDGSNVNYTVPANTYFSTISQYDADSKALNAAQAGAQSYANSNGTCTAINTSGTINVSVSSNAGTPPGSTQPANFTALFYNQCNSQSYYFYVNGNTTTTGTIPPGTYNVTVSLNGPTTSKVYTITLNGATQTTTYSTQFSNVAIISGASINIY